MAHRPRRIALLSDCGRRIDRLGMVLAPGTPDRRLDLHRPVHPFCDLGLRGVAKQCVGDGSVARCAARDPHPHAARHANSDAARAPKLGRRVGRDRGCSHFRRCELRHLGDDGRHGGRCPAVAKLAGLCRPVGRRHRRRLARLRRHQRRLALLAADGDQSRQCRQAPQGLGGPCRRPAKQPRLREALRDGEYADQSREPALYLHRQERHRRARRRHRQAGLARRSAGARYVDPVHDGLPRRILLPGPRGGSEHGLRRSDHRRARWIRG